MLNFLLTGQLDWAAPAQRSFARELAKRAARFSTEELAQGKTVCRAAVSRAEALAHSLVETEGYPYLAGDRAKLETAWSNALLTEFDWIELAPLARLFSHAMAAAYEEERRRRG